MSHTEKIKGFFDKRYKALLIIPVLVLLLSFGIIANHYFKTGNFIEKDITLKGGVSVTAITTKEVDMTSLENELKSKYPGSDVRIRGLTEAGKNAGLVMSVTDISADELSAFVKEKLAVTENDIAVESTGASLGASFFHETLKAIIIAFLFMGVVVFFYFRIPIPSLAVVLSAVCSAIGTWAVLVLFDVKLSTAGVAALLMIIGYSVDTDILLTARVMRRKTGVSIFEATVGAFKTGMVMTLTAIATVSICYFLSSSLVLKQIMLILMIGLCFDIINTWIQNAGILRWYLEKKGDRIKPME